MARSITDEEIGLIKAMLARGERNVDIQFYFNRQDRPANSGRISQIRNGTYGPEVPQADEDELDAFLQNFEATQIGVAIAGVEEKPPTVAETELTPVVEGLPSVHRRVFRYNAACAELALGDPESASKGVQQVIREYYELIGLTPAKVMGNNAPELARMINKRTDVDDIKHLADALDVFAKAGDAMGEPAPFARIHALKFYDLARAPESLFRVGQDLVDQFISMRDFDGALEMMDTIILPQLQQWKPVDYMITVRSQYAVVLAYCSRFEEAEAEMARLEPYKSGLPPLVQKELENQEELIAQLRRNGPPPKWLPPNSITGSRAKHPGGMIPDGSRQMWSGKQKVGRNERCPCGSGKKFKHCHGRG